jgi:hypothetical protein
MVQPSAYGTDNRAMLRVFSNINTANRPRVWQVGEPFAPVAGRYVAALRPQRPPLRLARQRSEQLHSRPPKLTH